MRLGRITPEQLAKLTADIAEVEGRLRNTHLQAHLQLKQLLTAEQVARYDRRRGYTPEDTAPSTTPVGHKSEEHDHADGHQ